jgi:hypothetical protein
MNLHTARLLVPVNRRHDFKQDRLPWLPETLYEDKRERWEKTED